MKAPNFSQERTPHFASKPEQIENLLEKLPKEIRERWEKEIEDKNDEEAIAILEAVFKKRSQILEGVQQNISPEGLLLEDEIEKAVEEILRLNAENKGELLGQGKHGRVIRYSEKICIKFSTDSTEERRRRKAVESEAGILDTMYGFAVDGVKVPRGYIMGLKRPPFYIGMETVQGKSLQAIVEKKEESAHLISLLKHQNKEEVILRIQGFLKRMHMEKRITHRDIHEGNIMIDDHGDWYIIDFGSAKEISFDDKSHDEKEEDLEYAKKTILKVYESIKNF